VPRSLVDLGGLFMGTTCDAGLQKQASHKSARPLCTLQVHETTLRSGGGLEELTYFPR